LATSFVCKIYNHREEVTDPRVNRGANHPLIEMIFLTLCASICDAEGWVDVEDPKLRRYQSGETARRRAEIREVVVLPAPKHCSVLACWEGIKTIGLIYRSREINGQVQESSETFISSLAPKVRDHAKRIREHWGIENKQHWILDVTFSEDSSRIRKGSSPEISSVSRRLALNPTPSAAKPLLSLENRGFRGDSGDSLDDSPGGKAAH
jgi:predicted transposase YbfD/YdcC